MRITTVGVVIACSLATATAVWFVEPGVVRSAGQTVRTFDLEETTVRSLLQDQQSGRRSARQIAEQYLSRIQALDRSGPSLAAMIELNPDALVIADTLDAERRASGMVSAFLQFEASQRCSGRVAPVPGGNGKINVNSVGIVIGQQDGRDTDEGVAGQTTQPIVYGPLSYTGEWRFKRIQ